MTTKAQVTELVQQLRDAAKLQDPIAIAAVKLVMLSADMAKESLVGADGDDMLRLQGSARAFHKLHAELTTNPPSISATETAR